LFTLGREPLQHLDEIPPEQFWTLRALEACPGNDRCEVIGARGPFHIEDERALFLRRKIDVLISKNSGSVATEPKLEVARELGVPVLILKRPPLPEVDRAFDLREYGGSGFTREESTRCMAPASPVFAGEPAPTGNAAIFIHLRKGAAPTAISDFSFKP
jgi:hypothetical protein